MGIYVLYLYFHHILIMIYIYISIMICPLPVVYLYNHDILYPLYTQSWSLTASVLTLASGPGAPRRTKRPGSGEKEKSEYQAKLAKHLGD